MTRPRVPGGLYAITAAVRGRRHREVAEAALAGGASMIQLRDKSMTTRELLDEAAAILALCRGRGVPFIINDRVDVALAVGADGVHVGDDDMPVAEARRLLGPDAIIGASADSVATARAAADDGADYLGVGPMFATETKPDAGVPVGPQRIREIKGSVNIPVFGIGGITAENAGEVMAAGADGVAVISAIAEADDVAEAARAMVRAVGGE
jgi:thiamine-phosphate diphosphorylase